MAAPELTITKTKTVKHWYPPPQGEWTYRDYVKLPDNNMRYEIIKGELHMSPAPRPKHQLILGELHACFRQYVIENDLGQIILAPVDVIMGQLATPVQPDLVFVDKDNLESITDKNIRGAPTLVVEVISPGSAAYDREDKFALYAEAGVGEYWIVDGEASTIEVYVLRGQAYAPLGIFTADEEAFSEHLPGFTLKVGDVCAKWQF